jgi:hypothetical protein
VATETLRPNAAGDECNISLESGCSVCPNHYDCVDEADADDNATKLEVVGEATEWERDLYNIENHSVGSGTINKITLYFRCYSGGGKYVKGAIKSGTTVDETAQKEPYADFGWNWGTYAVDWVTNPHTTEAWTWDEIDSLQIGVALKSTSASTYPWCTQVYVEVDYTPPAARPHSFGRMPGCTARGRPHARAG